MEKQENCEECNSRFQLLLNNLLHYFDKKTKLLTKEEAFNNATYGKCMTREQYVSHRQADINSMIRSRIQNTFSGDTDYEKYFLTVSFNETEEECAEEIFKPFKGNGFIIVKISDEIELLKGNNVYLITWKDAENLEKISGK